ncbi:hypothetical protein ACTMUQ_41195 [Streptomyces sp. SD11]|uniref:hypothetical protein n=1 Tax=Streptomyces sp. SD11 TaxID=3452209 RepID=UPI003F892E25
MNAVLITAPAAPPPAAGPPRLLVPTVLPPDHGCPHPVRPPGPGLAEVWLWTPPSTTRTPPAWPRTSWMPGNGPAPRSSATAGTGPATSRPMWRCGACSAAISAAPHGR